MFLRILTLLLKDENGNDLHRRDYTAEDVAQLTNGTNVNLWVEAPVTTQPAKWIVWPNNGEWLERMSGTL